MKLTPARKSILAAGLLAAAVAVVLLRNPPAAVETAENRVVRPARIPRPTSSTPSEPEPPPQIEPEFLAEPAFPGEPEADRFLRSLETLAARDPKQALAQLATVQDAELLPLALGVVATAWANIDPKSAAKWVAGLDPDGQALPAAAGLISVWAASAPADCLAWVTQLSSVNLREASMVALANTWGSTDPQAALTRFLALESDEGSERGSHAIVSQWALSDPEAAVDFLAKMGAEPKRDLFLETALTTLTSQNPDLTWKFSAQISDPTTAEQIRSMALEAIAAARPQEAINLAADGGASETLLSAIARGWSSTDPAAAKVWIASLPDADLADRLLQMIPN